MSILVDRSTKAEAPGAEPAAVRRAAD